MTPRTRVEWLAFQLGRALSYAQLRAQSVHGGVFWPRRYLSCPGGVSRTCAIGLHRHPGKGQMAGRCQECGWPWPVGVRLLPPSTTWRVGCPPLITNGSNAAALFLDREDDHV